MIVSTLDSILLFSFKLLEKKKNRKTKHGMPNLPHLNWVLKTNHVVSKVFIRSIKNEYQLPHFQNEEKAEEVDYIFEGYRDTK